MRIEIAPRQALASARYCEIVKLCERAYGDDDDIAGLVREFGISTHVLLIDAHERLISHALWIERWLTHGGDRVRSAYVELVATDPEHQRQGHASAVMRALGNSIVSFDIGALSPSNPAFYARFGWETWRGPLMEQRPDGEILLSPAEEAVMILQRPGGPRLDLHGPLIAPWRPGDIW
jgi:aminoglycoside 2'-N-acetyltransferase I